MARIRTIKPDFWTDEKVLSIKPLTRLLFIGMWNFADDYGRLVFSPVSLKAKIFPGDQLSGDDVCGMLRELSGADLLMIYAAKGKEYIEITGWHNQKIDKRQASKIPGPFDDGVVVRVTPPTSADFPSPSPIPTAVMEGKGMEGKGDGGGGEAGEKPKSLISQEAFAVTSEILTEMGKPVDDLLAVGGPYLVQHWLSGGVSRDAIMMGVKTAMIHKKRDPPSTFKYFEKAVLRAAAELNRPLPKVEIREAEKVVFHAKPKSAIIQAADDLCRTIASFDGPARGPDELRGPAGEAPPRLLSNG